jgi:hypothetical protein
MSETTKTFMSKTTKTVHIAKSVQELPSIKGKQMLYKECTKTAVALCNLE